MWVPTRKEILSIICLIHALKIGSLAQPCPFEWGPPRLLSMTPGPTFSSGLAVVGDTIHAIYHYDISFYYRRSTNGGKSWQAQQVVVDSAHPQIWKRPLAASGSHVYVVSASPFAAPVRAIRVTRSTDGGLTWLQPQIILLGVSGVEDYVGQIVAAYDRYVYVVVRRTYPSPTHAFLIRSTDWGRTWDSLRQITFGERPRGSVDIMAQGASVHLSLSLDVSSSSRHGVGHIRSTDFGDTWSQVTVLSTLDAFSRWEPQVAVNNQGWVYIGWQDAKYGTIGGFAGTLLMRRSTDNGVTWRAEQQVSDFASVERSSLTASRNIVYAAWWDNRSGNLTPRVYSKASNDNGATWCIEGLVGEQTHVASDPQIASDDGHVHLSLRITADTLGQRVYYTRREIVTRILKHEEQPAIPAKLFAPYPNPFNSETIITFELTCAGEVRLGLYDILGREAAFTTSMRYDAGVHQIRYPAADLASGVYYVTMYFRGREEVKPIVLLR